MRGLVTHFPASKVIALIVAIFIAAPMFVVIPMSFSTAPSLEFPPPGYWLGYYHRFFTDRNWIVPLFNSHRDRHGTVVLTMLLAVRRRRSRWCGTSSAARRCSTCC